jgi:tagaturonate epimerase
MELSKYSFGIGDRFNQEGGAQLRALMAANASGIEIVPVWNKSDREHRIVHSEPEDTRKEADEAVREMGWNGPYFVDADHINMDNVDRFIDFCDFFTIDVASRIGISADKNDTEKFKKSCEIFEDKITVPGIPDSIPVTEDLLHEVTGKFLAAIKEAGRIYRHIASKKGAGNFITEISMDEVEKPQTPVDLLFILKMIANEKIPVQSIAPKFTGRFNKGVDYKGEIPGFQKEFEQDLLVIDYAVNAFGLPDNLKLSIHSGSDKFSIYPAMAGVLKKYNRGIHVKTAGTTWLEEVIGLALSGDEGLEMVKGFYAQALKRKEELCAPYADVIEMDDTRLPSQQEVEQWEGKKFADTLRHIPENPDYNPDFRQLMHVGYKVAAERKEKFTELLKKNADIVGPCVEQNIYERHLKRLFDL